MRGRWVWDDKSGRLVDYEEYHSAAYQAKRHAVSDLPSPMIIADHMEPVKSMLDGKTYDSKAALRATYKAAGVVEVGNDSSITEPKPFRKPKPDRKAIKASVHKAFSKAGFGA